MLDWLFPPMPNPDVIGQVKLTADDIDPDRAHALDEKVERAREYLHQRGLTQQPLYRCNPTRSKQCPIT